MGNAWKITAVVTSELLLLRSLLLLSWAPRLTAGYVSNDKETFRPMLRFLRTINIRCRRGLRGHGSGGPVTYKVRRVMPTVSSCTRWVDTGRCSVAAEIYRSTPRHRRVFPAAACKLLQNGEVGPSHQGVWGPVRCSYQWTGGSPVRLGTDDGLGSRGETPRGPRVASKSAM